MRCAVLLSSMKLMDFVKPVKQHFNVGNSGFLVYLIIHYTFLVALTMIYPRISMAYCVKCCACVVKVFLAVLIQDCDGYEDDLCPLVIDTAAMSPELGALKAERKKHEHSDVYEPLHDLDINQQDSSNQHVVCFPESELHSDTLDSTTGTLGNVSWSSSALISPSGIPKNKTGGRLISPSKTRRKSDKVGTVCVFICLANSKILCACVDILVSFGLFQCTMIIHFCT